MMTPQEQFDYKQKWKPGYTVRLHSDLADRGKDWCRRHVERHEWSMSEWTDVYEHTFHFEVEEVANMFHAEFGLFAKLGDTQ
jgi:uncharacterized protein YjlB